MSQETLAAPAILPPVAPHLAQLGFSGDPFPITPDADGYFFSPRLQGIFGELTHLIALRHGFILITGDVGVGKTTLQRRLMADLTAMGTHTALIFNTLQQDAALIKAINRDFRIACDSDCLSDQIDALNRFLIEQFSANRNCVLVIDDAQTLDLASLELIRQLSNLETHNSKLLQIVFFAQPEILDTLERHEIRQLRSRINRHLVIDALSREETDAYLRFRMECAGHAEALHLTPEALELLYEHSGGNPRRINLIMSRCLFGLDPQGERRVDDALMRQAVAESQLTPLTARAANEAPAVAPPAAPSAARRWLPLAMAAAVAAAFFAGRQLAPTASPPPAVAAAQPATASVEATQTATPAAASASEPANKPASEPPATPAPAPDTKAENSPSPSAEGEPDKPEKHFWAAYPGLEYLVGQLPAKRIESAALPELARLTEKHGWTPLLVHEGDPVMPGNATETCQGNPLLALAEGQRLAFFRASVASEEAMAWFSVSDEVRALQSQLARLGDYLSPVDGLMGGRTTAALARFQQRVGLPVNGRLDTATRYALSCVAKKKPRGGGQG